MQPTSVTIDLGVDATGRVTTVSVGGSPDARFDACLQGHLGDVASIGAGEALDTRTAVSLGAQ